MALSINSGVLQMQWVVNGISVTNATGKTNGNEPKNLNGNIILGVLFVSHSAFPWVSERFDLTNLTIFSSALSTKTMQSFTKNGTLPGKPYLDWQDIDWSLHGEISIQTNEQFEFLKHS